MKCEKCNEKEANFFYEENVNGEKRSYHLCRACAEEMGLITKGKAGFGPRHTRRQRCATRTDL